MMNINNYNSLARVSKLPRLYKIIKIIRLTRMLKIAKEKSKLSKYLNEVLSFSIGFERFIFFLVFMVVLVHLAACFYFFIGTFASDERDSWYFQRDIQDDNNFDLYITCLYFVFTTITTVGFGDISGGTSEERIFCIVLMILGVLAFSFTTSSLSTLITNMDSRSAKLKSRLAQLNALNTKHNLSLRRC
jgi:predicted PurR-regulated permease PerM